MPKKNGKGNVLWPMRFALTWQDKSPDPFICASILGKEERKAPSKWVAPDALVRVNVWPRSKLTKWDLTL